MLVASKTPTKSKPHIEGRDCWCKPTLKRCCFECGHGPPDDQCWACDGSGLLPATMDETEEVVVIHNKD
jgi:hypothetical protein